MITLANVADVSAWEVLGLFCESVQLFVRELFGVPAEYGDAGLLVRERKRDREVDSAEHGWVQVVLAVGGTDQHDICGRLKAVYLSQECGEYPSTGLVHVWAATAGQCVYLVNENDDFS